MKNWPIIVKLVISVIAAIGAYYIAGRIIDQIMEKVAEYAEQTEASNRAGDDGEGKGENIEDFENLSSKIAQEAPEGEVVEKT